jgi:tetratricopeptide (TPR) repeat protein
MFAYLLVGWFLAQPQVVSNLTAPNPLDISPEIRSYLDDKVPRNDPPMLRLQELVSTVFQDRDLNFSYSLETRSAIETFSARNGNCLSFTILFIAMARHVGLDARFREVEIAPTWSKNGQFVNLNLHVNAGVYIDGLAYAIDVFPVINRIEIGARPVPDERGLAHYYNNLGANELGKGNLDGAELWLRRALEVDPTTVGVWINFGATKGQAQQLKEAEQCYRKALELEPGNQAAMGNLAGLCERMGRSQEAKRLQAKIKKFREKNPYHHFNLGQQAFAEGLVQESIVHYKKALKLKAGEHNFHFALARSFSQLGQVLDAEKSLQLAMKYAADPTNKARYAEKLELLKNMRTQHGGID